MMGRCEWQTTYGWVTPTVITPKTQIRSAISGVMARRIVKNINGGTLFREPFYWNGVISKSSFPFTGPDEETNSFAKWCFEWLRHPWKLVFLLVCDEQFFLLGSLLLCGIILRFIMHTYRTGEVWWSCYDTKLRPFIDTLAKSVGGDKFCFFRCLVDSVDGGQEMRIQRRMSCIMRES